MRKSLNDGGGKELNLVLKVVEVRVLVDWSRNSVDNESVEWGVKFRNEQHILYVSINSHPLMLNYNKPKTY